MSARCCFCEQHAALPRPIANAFGRPSGILCRQERPAVPDHPMVCKGHKMDVTMCRDMRLGAWHCIVHRAGVATATEPAMSRLWPRDTQPTWDRGGGDLLVMFWDTGLVVAGVLRTHPAAQRLVWNSPRAITALAATCDQEKCQQGHADSCRAGLQTTANRDIQKDGCTSACLPELLFQLLQRACRSPPPFRLGLRRGGVLQYFAEIESCGRSCVCMQLRVVQQP
jgi:hypothetical protein